MTRPTIEDVVEALKDLTAYGTGGKSDQVIDAFLAKEPEQEGKIPVDFLSNVSKLQADLDLAKEGLSLANKFCAYRDSTKQHRELFMEFRSICKKLGLD